MKLQTSSRAIEMRVCIEKKNGDLFMALLTAWVFKKKRYTEAMKLGHVTETSLKGKQILFGLLLLVKKPGFLKIRVTSLHFFFW